MKSHRNRAKVAAKFFAKVSKAQAKLEQLVADGWHPKTALLKAACSCDVHPAALKLPATPPEPK